MQTFETFECVYRFFIRSHFDSNYVRNIDASIENGSATKPVKTLIQRVRAFHSLRGTLCKLIKARLKNCDILDILLRARGVEQYNFVPKQSTCMVSGSIITPKEGILLMVDHKEMFTIHTRYKILLYQFWFLAHFPQEIGLEAKQWLEKFAPGSKPQDMEKNIERFIEYEDHSFPKKNYVKLKGMNRYIQSELAALPINRN